MITSTLFVARFPEFNTLAPTVVENAIAQTLIEVSEYEGLGNLELQQQAIMLHVAHNLTLGKWAAEGKAGAVKSIASYNDKIEYAVNPYAGLSLESTHYGARLQALLARANTILAALSIVLFLSLIYHECAALSLMALPSVLASIVKLSL